MNAVPSRRDEHSRGAVEHYDPVLDSIFSALGVDEGFLDDDSVAQEETTHVSSSTQPVQQDTLDDWCPSGKPA